MSKQETPPRPEALHLERNAQTRGGWAPFAAHRSVVTRLLIEQGKDKPRPTLCVLGAGNCNDLDLAALLEAFSTIHLVDLDAEALAEGARRQGVAQDARLAPHGGVDLSGILSCIACWRPEAPADDAEIERCLARARQGPELRLPRCDVAVSTCLLSQMIDSLGVALGDRHSRFFELVSAVRSRHVRLLADLTAPGGRCALVSDIVSSRTYPPLAQTPLHALPATLQQLIAQGNFFTGLNPVMVARVFLHDPLCAGLFEEVRLSPPWLWDLGPRVYAVCAALAKRVH